MDPIRSGQRPRMRASGPPARLGTAHIQRNDRLAPGNRPGNPHKFLGLLDAFDIEPDDPRPLASFQVFDAIGQIDVGLIADTERLAETQDAIERGRRIRIHGDYDADGISGTAVLTLGLLPLWETIPIKPSIAAS